MVDVCIFREIINGNEPAGIVYEDELTIVFVDIR